MPAQIIKISNIPPKVDLKHLGDPLKKRLVSEAEQDLLMTIMSTATLGRYSKKSLGKKIAEHYTALQVDQGEEGSLWPEGQAATYGLVKEKDGSLYAVYKGKKHNKLIGESDAAKVKLAQNIQNGEWVVLKVIIRPQTPENDNKVKLEHKILSALGFCSGSLIEREGKYNIIMTYIPGKDLIDFFEQDPELSEFRLLDMALQMSKALDELHQQGFLHCDMKLDNLMIQPRLNHKITLIDFGLALELEGKKKVRACARGTRAYLAPEINFARPALADIFIFQGTLSYSIQTEVYALGVTIENIFYGSPLIKNPVVTKMLAAMKDVHPRRRPFLKEVIKTLNELRKSCLAHAVLLTSLIRMDDFLEAKKDHEVLKAFLKDLQAFDEVIIVDENLRELSFYCEVFSLLADKGVAIRNEVLISPDSAEQLFTAQSLHQEKAELPRSCCFFAPAKKNQAFFAEAALLQKTEAAKQNKAQKPKPKLKNKGIVATLFSFFEGEVEKAASPHPKMLTAETFPQPLKLGSQPG